MSSPADRRANPRFGCDLDVIVHSSGREPVHARAADLSLAGLCFASDVELVPGEPLEFQVRLVLGWTESDYLRLEGQVVWCRVQGGAFLVGGRFDPELAEDKAERLALLVRILSGELLSTSAAR